MRLILTTNIVEKPINFRVCRTNFCFIQLTSEVRESSFFISFVDMQRRAQVFNVLWCLQFRDPSGQHEREKSDQKAGMFPQDEVCFFAKTDEPGFTIQ